LPSHTNIFLGVTPLYHGIHDNLNFIVNEHFLTLAEHLSANGYDTAAFVGAYPLDSRFGLAQGFDIYDDEYPHSHDQALTALERRAEDVIDRTLEGMKNLNSPWFVWIHCYDPHLPYDPPEPYKSRFEKNPYDGEVAYVDFVMGRLLRYLEERELFDETFIVFTGDHGESLGEHGEMSHGFFAYNTTIWIPLILNIPGVESKEIKQYVSHVDIFPTICDVVGIEKPSYLQGISLLSVLNGKSLSDRPLYFESMYPYYSHGWAPLMGLIRGHEKFIESPIPELYDLEKDFDEQKNLATQKNLDGFQKHLERIIIEQSSAESVRSKEKLDPDALKKLKSLGYVSSSKDAENKSFGPENDVKILLSFHNQTHQAMILHGKGKSREAEQMLSGIIMQRKDIGIAYIRLGILYMDVGKTGEALKILRQGLSQVPWDYDVYLSYIKALRQARMFDQIIEDFHEGSYTEISFDPEIWNILGFAYAMEKSWDKAAEAYEYALSLDDRYAETNYNLGEVYLELAFREKNQNFIQKSLERFKKAIEIDQNYPYPYFGLGKIYRQVGDLNGAINSWKKATELQPDFDMALYNLGKAYLDKDDKVRAIECFLELKRTSFHKYTEEMKKRIDELIARCIKQIPS
jgi:tetratricopeptide (TPR) repeat protein